MKMRPMDAYQALLLLINWREATSDKKPNLISHSERDWPMTTALQASDLPLLDW